MTTNVLNIGAGVLPLVASDLAVDQVVNYDPLTALNNEDKAGKSAVLALTVLSLQDPNLHYARREAQVDAVYANGSVDLILSISPYGFTLVSAWAHGKLKPGGCVLVVSNERNAWASDFDRLIADIPGAVYKVVEHPEPWISAIRRKIMRDYPSSTSTAERPTLLNQWVCFEKQ